MDSTINPVELLNIGEGQSMTYTHNEWYEYYDFRAIEARPVKKKPEKTEENDGVIHITVK